MSNEIREAAQRATGYIRAWQLLSNVDREQLGEVSIKMPGTERSMTFTLQVADLEALVSHAIGATPIELAPGTVAISAEEYLDLQGDANELAALHAAGVDNWEGYAEARSGR